MVSHTDEAWAQTQRFCLDQERIPVPCRDLKRIRLHVPTCSLATGLAQLCTFLSKDPAECDSPGSVSSPSTGVNRSRCRGQKSRHLPGLKHPLPPTLMWLSRRPAPPTESLLTQGWWWWIRAIKPRSSFLPPVGSDSGPTGHGDAG